MGQSGHDHRINEVLASFFWRWSPLRNWPNLPLPFYGGKRDIEGAKACVIVRDIRIAVVAGAYYVAVRFAGARSESARARRIAVALLVDDEALDQVLGESFVRVEEIAGCDRVRLQSLIEGVYLVFRAVSLH
jgi:hypothetical protein